VLRSPGSISTIERPHHLSSQMERHPLRRDRDVPRGHGRSRRFTRTRWAPLPARDGSTVRRGSALTECCTPAIRSEKLRWSF